MHKNNDVIIAGGGLAGLVAAIHLSRSGLNVTVIEKQPYPTHKVCGEYVSNEVLPYLRWLDADPASLHPTHLTHFQFASLSGRVLQAQLPLGGFGLSRHAFDQFLMEKAIESGCTLLEDQVTTFQHIGASTQVHTATNGVLEAPVVLGAYGKRTALDHQLQRSFISRKSPWLAVKGHYTGSFPAHLVALYQIRGGYCGLSQVEEGRINACYLTSYAEFKKHKSIQGFQEEVLFQNEHLAMVLRGCRQASAPISISQISFEKKELVKDHILMIGDAAGMIHPLCGNGMAMAIHSAKIAAECVIRFFQSGQQQRAGLEQSYQQRWRAQFNQRLFMGRFLSHLLEKETLAQWAMSSFVRMPFLLPHLIKRTHGQPLSIAG